MNNGFRIYAAMCAATLLAGSSPAAFAGDTLTILSWGGAYVNSQREAFFKPYMAAGNKIVEDEYNGEIAKLRAMVEAKSVTWDVVDVDTQTALAACAEGVLQKIDWNRLGLKQSDFLGGDLIECAVPNTLYSTVLAYDTTRLTPAPTRVEDLFDLQKFPGKRGLQNSPVVNLEWALIADGVPANEVYKELATDAGVERALKKLDTIKASIVWWDSGAQPPQMLADGQVVMASDWSGRFDDAIKKEKKPFKVLWDRQAPDWDWWAIPTGAPNTDAAYRFIAYASDPQRMANQTNFIAYGPANNNAMALVKPAILPDLPTSSGNMKTAIKVDPQFWADHLDQITERFNTWLAK